MGDSKRTTPLHALPAFAGGLLAILASFALLTTLMLRGVSLNALNLYTITVAAFAGTLSIRSARREDAGGLGWGLILLLMAVVPAIFGWVPLLYAPALLTLLFAAAVFIVGEPAE